MGPMIDPDDVATIGRVLHPVRGADALIRDVLLPSFRADYAALEEAARDADAIVTHPITFAAPVVAQVRRLTWISTVLAPMSFFSATDPPVLAPAPFLAGLARFGSWYGHVVAQFARAQTRPWMKPVFELRRELAFRKGNIRSSRDSFRQP
jgi:hypothetical protein